MCGITGFLAPRGGSPTAEAERVVRTMADALHHRGPDDVGTWVGQDGGIALGHRRLSILDLSPAGHQPMVSACGRYVLVFNGEIYNHEELRAELTARSDSLAWQGHSDTEVLLAAAARLGLEETLKRSIGMFALALWDRRDRVLHLARDRMGEKPLYYGWSKGALLFGSELKALRVHPAWQGEVDRRALALYMRYMYVPSPWSIQVGIHKLPPGCVLSLPLDAAPDEHSPFPEDSAARWTPKRYWSIERLAAEPRSTITDETEALDHLESVLSQAIGRQMIADVPLGAFLSGGIDSSLIVALMQAQSARRVRTFTIGVNDPQYNEAEDAARVAARLGTDHTELYIEPTDALEIVPRIPDLYDEPFADSSQMPTHLVAAMAREHVTVALSGDGGDELFGGYNRYTWGRGIWERVDRLPRVLRHLAAGSLLAVSPASWDRWFERLRPVLPSLLRQRMPGDRLHKLAGFLKARSPEEMYRLSVSLWNDPNELVLGAREPSQSLPAKLPEDFSERMMLLDALTYLPDDILVKVDRAAMGVSLETRAPFLDHTLVEAAWGLPLDFKVRGPEGKWALRQILYRHVPREMIERPKMGFGVPVDSWLRGPLRDWAEDLLSEERLRCEGYLNPVPVRRRWAEHLSGKRNWQYALWGVLMFQAWLESVR